MPPLRSIFIGFHFPLNSLKGLLAPLRYVVYIFVGAFLLLFINNCEMRGTLDTLNEVRETIRENPPQERGRTY